MKHTDASLILGDVFNRPRVVYLWTEPEVLDFTSASMGRIVLAGGGHRVEFDVDPEDLPLVLSHLKSSVFNKDLAPTLLCWNLKSILSYAKHYVKSIPEITSPIYDLQIIENFLGFNLKRPASLSEALERFKAVSGDKTWKSLYTKLHLPLMQQVLPSLETCPILDVNERDAFYAHYEIEGQQNGRLKCAKRFEKGYLAHTLGTKQKADFRARGYNVSFMVADISNCEVTVLQWLSEDQNLASMMKQDKDLYREIYKIITKDECDSDKKRTLSQYMFLAVIYGSMSRGLSKSLNIPEPVAKELRKRIIKSFPECMDWLQHQQDEAGVKKITDYFGRPRNFTDRPYLARNFVVQGVAATVCLEKLVSLHHKFANTPVEICFSIHDGYGFVVPNNRIHETARQIKEILESPSNLCPGLIMKAKIEIGTTLDKLKTYVPEEF